MQEETVVVADVRPAKIDESPISGGKDGRLIYRCTFTIFWGRAHFPRSDRRKNFRNSFTSRDDDDEESQENDEAGTGSFSAEKKQRLLSMSL